MAIQGYVGLRLAAYASPSSLKLHLTETFRLSNDSDFEAKLVEIVGLSLDPPEHAILLSAGCVTDSRSG